MEIKCRTPGKTKSNNMDKTVDIIVQLRPNSTFDFNVGSKFKRTKIVKNSIEISVYFKS